MIKLEKIGKVPGALALHFRKTCSCIILLPAFFIFQVLLPSSTSRGGNQNLFPPPLKRRVLNYWLIAVEYWWCFIFKFTQLVISLFIVFSNKSKCCLKTITLAIFDLPQSVSGFLLEKFCLVLKFLNHLSPESVSELNVFGKSLFPAVAHTQRLSLLQLKESD